MADNDKKQIQTVVSDRKTVMGNRKQREEKKDLDFLRLSFKEQQKLLRETINTFKNDKTEQAQLGVLKDLLKFMKEANSYSKVKSEADAKRFIELNKQSEAIIKSLRAKAGMMEVDSLSRVLEKYAKDTGKKQEDLNKLLLSNINDMAKGKGKVTGVARQVEKVYSKSELGKAAIEFVGQVFAAPVLATVKSSKTVQEFAKSLKEQREKAEVEEKRVIAGIQKKQTEARIKEATDRARTRSFEEIDIGEPTKKSKDIVEQERIEEKKATEARENSEVIRAEIEKGNKAVIAAIGGEEKKTKEDKGKGLFGKTTELTTQLTALGVATKTASLALSGVKSVVAGIGSVVSGLGGLGKQGLGLLGGGSAMTGAGVVGGAVIAGEVAYLAKIKYDEHKAKSYTAKVNKETMERRKKLIAIRLAKRHRIDVNKIGEMLEKTGYNVAAVDRMLGEESKTVQQVAMLDKAGKGRSREEEILSRVDGEQRARVPEEITRTRYTKKLGDTETVIGPVHEVEAGIVEKDKPYREVGTGVKQVPSPVGEVGTPVYQLPEPATEVKVTKKPKRIERGARLSPQQEALMGKRKRTVKEVGLEAYQVTPVTEVPAAPMKREEQLTPQQLRLMRRERGTEVPSPVREVTEGTKQVTGTEIIPSETIPMGEKRKEAEISVEERIRRHREATVVESPTKVKASEVQRVEAVRVEDTVNRETNKILKEIKQSLDKQQVVQQVKPEEYRPSPATSQYPNHVDDLPLVLLNQGG